MWCPPSDPQHPRQVRLWARYAAQGPRRAAGAMVLALACAVVASLVAGQLLISWALIAAAGLWLLLCLEVLGASSCQARVWRAVERRYGPRPRPGQPSGSKAAVLAVTSAEDRFHRTGVGVGVWRTRGGCWQRIGWAERPQWFTESQLADAYAQRLQDELAGAQDALDLDIRQ